MAYARRLAALPDPSGALVFYAAVQRQLLPPDTPPHLQLAWPSPGSLFVSVSREGDGRAPLGQATVIASVFTQARPWFALARPAYAAAKASANAFAPTKPRAKATTKATTKASTSAFAPAKGHAAA